MAMNGDALGMEIFSEINRLSDDAKGNTQEVWKAIGRAIVRYLQNNMEVQLADVLMSALANARVSPNDGGATLKTDLSTYIGQNPNRSKVR